MNRKELAEFSNKVGLKILDNESAIFQAFVLIQHLRTVNPTLARLTLKALAAQETVVSETNIAIYRDNIVHPVLRDYINSSQITYKDGRTYDLSDPINAALSIVLGKYPHAALKFQDLKYARDLDQYEAILLLEGKVSEPFLDAMARIPASSRDFYLSILAEILRYQQPDSIQANGLPLALPVSKVESFLFLSRRRDLTEEQIREALDPVIINLIAEQSL